MIFEDMTIKCIHTTLNEEYLAHLGIKPRKDYLFDLDRGIFIPISLDAKQIEIIEDEPQFEEGVLAFAKRFI